MSGNEKKEEKIHGEYSNFEINEKILTLLTNSFDIISILSATGVIKYESPAAERVLGYKLEERLGKNVFEFVHPDDLETVLYEFNTRDKKVKKLEFRLLHKNGSWRWFEAIGQDFTGDEKISGFIVNSRDITERKKAEVELLKSEERFRLMIKNSNDTFILLNAKGEQIFVSQSVLKLTGFTEAEVRRPFSSLIHQDDLSEVNNLFDKILEDSSQKYCIQYRHKHKEKGWIWLEAIGQNFLKNSSLQAIIVNVREISKQKEREFLFEKQTQELQQLNEDKNRFMRILGHDLRSPFNALLGFSELLEKNIDIYSKDKIKGFVSRIKDLSHNTYNLLNDLLLWSKSQSGSLPFSPEKIYFKELCLSVKQELEFLFLEKNIHVYCNDNQDLMLYVDKNMFKTIFRNLFSNAIKFSHRESEIKISYQEKTDEIELIFSDSGVGIKPSDVEKIWNKSTIYTTKGTEKETGTGLGLLLCKEFVEKHNGKIWVESEFGKGSDFKILLPRNNYELNKQQE